MENEIAFGELFSVLRRALLKMIILLVIFGGAGYVYAKKVAKSDYSSKFSVLIKENTQSKHDSLANFQQLYSMMIGTSKDLLKSDTVLDPTVKELRSDYGYKKSDFSISSLGSSLDVKNESNSQVIEIDVKQSTPKKAKDVAKVLSKVFKSKANKMMPRAQFMVVSGASEPSKVGVSGKKFALAGGVLGLLLGYVWQFAVDVLKRR